ncbi:MAG: BamA/TamA family outer membrane protein, partial [Bacteroidaceae bacterium]|nr:BamA/TamA family outer membrane protein [Bacteroidaceae bacterium]
SFGSQVGYTYQRRPTVKHELTLFRLDYNMQLRSTERFDSIMACNPALAVSMRDQFVPSMQYVLNMTSRQGARNPRKFTLMAKEAGNVTSGVYCAFGQEWKRHNKNLFGVPFAQYFKVTAEYTERVKIRHTRTYVAARLFAGAVVSYGNSTIAPYNDLFTVGGANSIRAFGVRSIGPGGYDPRSSGYSYIDEMGDLKLEANVEYRFPIVANLNGAVFLDAGNVWLRKADDARKNATLRLSTMGREIALGTGFGFRYDLDFLVVRFDVGVGLHAPYDTGKRGYYNMTSFRRSLGYHIAIGYPF